VVKAYVPDSGDLVWLAGHRPALVLSPRSYNAANGMAVMCPVTSRIKGYPFEVALPTSGPVQGVVLADQIKNLDWRARNVSFIAASPDATMAEVRARLKPLLGLA
jgi:mRNA interferase MazF